MASTSRSSGRAGICRFARSWWDLFAGDVTYGHAGSQAGYAALLTILPERQAVIVVVINDEAADPFLPITPAA